LGPSRCIFIVDESRPNSAWLDFINQSIEPTSEDRFKLHLLSYPGDDPNKLGSFIALAREMVAQVPIGTVTVDHRMIGFVRSHVAAEHWSTPFSERDWGQFILALMVGFGIGVVILLLPPSIRRFVSVGQAAWSILLILLVMICYFQALHRSWRDAIIAARFRQSGSWNPKTRLRWSRWLMVVAVGVCTLAYVILPLAIHQLEGSVEAVHGVRVQSDIQSIRTQLMLYEGMNGFYPTTEQGLQALVTRPTTEPLPTRWAQTLEQLPKDPWKRDYVYRCPGIKNVNGFDLFSAGPDGIPDTPDDDWGGKE
jgi:general secretion pathway protein G